MKKKQEVQKKLIKELVKEDWNSRLVENLIVEFNEAKMVSDILRRVSDQLPFIAAEICGVEVTSLVSGSRKWETIMALKLCYKELYDKHD